MRKIFLLFFLCFLGAGFLWADDYSAWRNEHSDWVPVLCDDFTGSSLDTKVWERIPYVDYEVSDWRRYQSTDPGFVQQNGGQLTLWGRYGNYTTQNNQKEAQQTYACGGVQTLNTFSFQYGYVEIRAKFNHTWGVWPALWLMPKNGGSWPVTGEIDMMEHLNNDDVVYQTLHYGAGDASKRGTVHDFGSVEKLDQQWHTYGLLWEEGKISFLVDGNITQTFVANASWPFDNEGNEFYLILDQQIGGSWVQGAAKEAGYSANGGINQEALSKWGSAMTLDYVHVYSASEYAYTPEPSTAALSLLSLAALAFRRRRRFSSARPA